MERQDLIKDMILIEVEKLRRIIINATDEDMALALKAVAKEYEAKQS